MAITAVLNTVTPIPTSPTLRMFDVSCLDADTGPTSFNHGIVGLQTNQLPLSMLVWRITAATTVIPNWGVTVTATQFTLSKQNIAGSGGAVPGTTVVLSVILFGHTIL